MTSARFGTSRIRNCPFMLPASTLSKYSNLKIYQVPFPWFSACFLGLLTCCYLYKLQITLWCLNFYSVHKGEIQCPPPPFTICSDASKGPVLDPVLESSPLAGGRSCDPSASSTRLNRVTSVNMSIKSIWLFCFSVLPGESDRDAVEWGQGLTATLTGCYMWPCWRSGKTHTTHVKENLFFICWPLTQAELCLSILLSQNRFFVDHVQFSDSAKYIAIGAVHISQGVDDYVLYIL